MNQKDENVCFKADKCIGNEKRIYDYLKVNGYGFVSKIANDLQMKKETAVKVISRLWENRILLRISVHDFAKRYEGRALVKANRFMEANRSSFCMKNLNVYMIDVGSQYFYENAETTEKSKTIEQSIFDENK